MAAAAANHPNIILIPNPSGGDASDPPAKVVQPAAAAADGVPHPGRRVCALPPPVMAPIAARAAAVQRMVDDGHTERARGIVMLRTKWMPGTTITYAFLATGASGRGDAYDEAQRAVVRRKALEWQAVGIGLRLVEVAPSLAATAQVRIAFNQTDGSWSYVGRDCLTAYDDDPTMNLGWDLRESPDTAAHEWGHALGFAHEHQNPAAGITWNEDAVYAALSAPPNSWSRETIYENILRKLAPADIAVGSPWDPSSIMEYPFEPGLIRLPAEYAVAGLQPPGVLSAKDRAVALQAYPPTGVTPPPPPSVHPQLLPFQSAVVRAASPGDSVTYRIEPDVAGAAPGSTITLVVQTLGAADTYVTVSTGGEPGTVVAQDDDSGVDRNALVRWTIKVPNASDAPWRPPTYVVRSRLYSTRATGMYALIYHQQ